MNLDFNKSEKAVVDLEVFIVQMEPVDGYMMFLNIRTGEYVMVNEDYLRRVEHMKDLQDLSGVHEFEKEEIMNILDIEENFDEYEALPTKFDLDEYSIMEDFIETLEDRKVIEQLEEAIIGKRAFRRFKDTISSLGLSNAWYNYRDQFFLEIAKSWCEERNIPHKIRKSEIGE